MLDGGKRKSDEEEKYKIDRISAPFLEFLIYGSSFLFFNRTTASEAPRGSFLIICCLNRYCFERPLRYSIV